MMNDVVLRATQPGYNETVRFRCLKINERTSTLLQDLLTFCLYGVKSLREIDKKQAGITRDLPRITIVTS